MSNNYNIENPKKATFSLSRLCKSDNINTTGNALKINQHNYHSVSGINREQKDPNEVLSELLDNLNKNSLNIFYRDSSSNFKRKIDELNLNFYLETEKYLSNQNKQEKTQSSLFIILFKQIKIYIEEIERLNLIILEKKYDPRNTIERTDEILKKQKNFETNQQLIKTLKDSKSITEGKLLEALLSEDKLRKENERLKQENEYFKKQYLSKNMSKTLTQSIFHSKTLNNFINNERGASDITKANSNLSNEYTIEHISNKKRNNSDNDNISFSLGFNTYHRLVNHSNEPKKSMGIIKSVKEKLKNEKKFNSGNLCNKRNIDISNFHTTKPSPIIIHNNNKLTDFDIPDFKNLDFNFNSNSNKPTIRPEIILSDLEDYTNNNFKSTNSNITNKETISISNFSPLNINNQNNSNINYGNNNYNNSYNNNNNNNLTPHSNKKVVFCNNKKIIQKKVPIIKVKMNK